MNSDFYSGSNCENLGETILITALLTSEGQQLNQQQLKKLADECIVYHNVLQSYFPANSKDTIDSFNRAAKLYSSPIFQYGVVTEFQNYRNILVWFFLDEKAKSLLNDSDFKDKLSELFLIRHLIVQDFQAASEPSTNTPKNSIDKSAEGSEKSIYKLADGAYAEIKRLINEGLNVEHANSTRLTEAELKKFNQAIIDIIHKEFEYSTNLEKIEKILERIVKNTRKYNEKMLQLASLFSGNNGNNIPSENENIKFLVNFGEKTCLYFQDQIKADLCYLRDGSQLIEKAISTFRTQIQIDQAERERSLQNTILFLTFSNIGMAAAGISASSYNYRRENNNQKQDKQDRLNPLLSPPLPAPLNELNSTYISSICYSLIFGMSVWVAVWLICSLLLPVLQYMKKNKKPSNETANAAHENKL
jgi:hypothetical protein